MAYLTVPEVAAMTGRNPILVRRWCRDGRLPAVRVGRDWLIPEESVGLVERMERRRRRRTIGAQGTVDGA